MRQGPWRAQTGTSVGMAADRTGNSHGDSLTSGGVAAVRDVADIELMVQCRRLKCVGCKSKQRYSPRWQTAHGVVAAHPMGALAHCRKASLTATG